MTGPRFFGGPALYNACIVGRVVLFLLLLDNAAFALPRAYGASAFILPLVALYPPSWSAALALHPLRCAGARVVRLCPSPVGRAQRSG